MNKRLPSFFHAIQVVRHHVDVVVIYVLTLLSTFPCLLCTVRHCMVIDSDRNKILCSSGLSNESGT
jgi:hypothetical protein